MRDDFTIEVKRHLAGRVGHVCSNPTCRASTAGPQDDSARSVNLGVAAHISGASPGGPRYNPLLTAQDRSHINNAIWLCQNCAKLVDSDISRFSQALLQSWRLVAEDIARSFLGKTANISAGQGEVTSPLELIFETEGISGYTYSPRTTPIRKFSISMKNTGITTIKFPSISFLRSLGLSVDNFGVDGNCNHGLPLAPANGERIAFNGGFNDVIRSGQTLTVAKLFQRGQDVGIEGINVTEYPTLLGLRGPSHSRWVFKEIIFECELAGDSIPTIISKQRVKSADAVWQRE